MTHDIYVYLANLPPGIHEVVTPCYMGYTIYLNAADSREMQVRSYNHALDHINNHDFEKSCVQSIEHKAHGADHEESCNLHQGII